MANLYHVVTVGATPSAISHVRALGYSARAMTDLHSRMRAALEASGLSQSELARRLGIRSQSVNQWLSGVRAPSREHLMAFVDATNCNLGWLLYGKQLPGENGNSIVPAREATGGRLVPLFALELIVAGATHEVSNKQVLAHFPCGPNAQAFPVPDDSCAPEYPAGSLWIVDRDEAARPGDLVVGAYGAPLVPVIGKYRLETTSGGQVTIIEPLNRDWPAARSDIHAGLVVLAVMTEAIRSGRNR